jgi:hypothetical protein
VCALCFDFCYQCATLPTYDHATAIITRQGPSLPWFILKLFSILLKLILGTQDERLWSHGAHNRYDIARTCKALSRTSDDTNLATDERQLDN